MEIRTAKAGLKVSDKNQAVMVPKPTKMPNTRTGGIGVMANARKPIAVRTTDSSEQPISQASRNREIARVAAVVLLAAALRGSRPNSAVERAVIVGMQHIVGVYRRRTRDSWLKWWDRSWTYWCVDDDREDESALKIALIKRNENYLITLNGQSYSPPELVENLREAVARGAVRAEIRCGGNVALAQFVELHRAAREAGLRDIRVLYADAVQP